MLDGGGGGGLQGEEVVGVLEPNTSWTILEDLNCHSSKEVSFPDLIEYNMSVDQVVSPVLVSQTRLDPRPLPPHPPFPTAAHHHSFVTTAS